jgi:enoyl-CoA hydratase/carnithine racemase
MNAISGEVLETLERLGREVLTDSNLRAVVLTGAGDRAFCAGADLKERRTMTDDQVRGRLLKYETALAWLSSPALPSIAMLNGTALGGGLELALCCDLRVAHEHVTLGLPETGFGIIPAAGGTQRLTRLVGEARAKEVILLGQRLTASAALTMGILHRVFPRSANLLDETVAFIRPILEGAPLAQSAALEAIASASEVSIQRGLAIERDCYERCLVSEDRLEALAAFRDKRKPQFRGK